MITLRILGGVLLVTACATVVADIRHSLDARTGLTFATMLDAWLAVHAGSARWMQQYTQASPHGWAGAITHGLLQAPAWLAAAAASVLSFALSLAADRTPLKARPPAEPSPAAGHAATGTTPGGELAQALWSCRAALIGIAVFSAVSNILMLTGSMFMLQVYDRVLPSRSVPTLVGLAVLVIVLFVLQGGLDLVRIRLLGRIGMALDAALSGRVYDVIVRLPVRQGSQHDSLQAMRDLDSIRSFVSGLGPTVVFDLPWLPIYLGIVFAFHTSLGITALVGALLLVAFTLATDLLTRRPTRDATLHGATRYRLAEASRRNAEVLTAMGLAQRFGQQWQRANSEFIAAQQQANDVGGGLGAISRVLRMMLQSLVLGVGAYLVIQQEASGGIIIASAILVGRALAPVDLAIGHWRSFVAARQGWARLKRLLQVVPGQRTRTPLPIPVATLSAEDLLIVAPGQQKAIVQQVNFTLSRGQGLGIVGPSGSGKSSLARVLVGAWLPARGRVRLDGAALEQWAPEELGRHIGYLPQDVELLSGSVALNICGFDAAADANAIIAAAREADVHDLIVGLPHGYDTEIGLSGALLSAGQRQRIGLARALFGNPFLVVLDEPDANLDVEGTRALVNAIQNVRARGGIVIVVAHRHGTLAPLDLVMALHQGQVMAMGPKDTVLKRAQLVSPDQPSVKGVPA